MVLVSIPVCLLFLSILVASSPYLTLSSLIVICIYLLLRGLMCNMSGSKFSVVNMLSPLISRILIYKFLLLSIIIIFYDLFDTICHISGMFYLLGWLQTLRFSWPLLNLSCSFAITRVSVLLSIWMTSWLCSTLIGQVRGLVHFLCSLLVCLGLYINFSKSDLCLTQTFCFLGLCWDTVQGSIFAS